MENHAKPIAGMVPHASRKKKIYTRIYMSVQNCDSSYEPADLNKIATAITSCCEDLDSIDTLHFTTRTIAGLYDGGRKW